MDDKEKQRKDQQEEMKRQAEEEKKKNLENLPSELQEGNTRIIMEG